MYPDINKYLFIFIGWLIHDSYQLSCIQCTSSIRRVERYWDHSCLDGTLKPRTCQESDNVNQTFYQQCTSDLYRVSGQGTSGVLVDRRCIFILANLHECDPVEAYKNFSTDARFFCRRTCSRDGCNRHSVRDILSNANQLFISKSTLLYFICIILLFDFECNLFS